MMKRKRIVVVAVLVALAGAWLGAFSSTRLAWEFAPDLPSGGEAGELAATAFPGLRVFGGGNAPVIEPYGDGEGIRYGSVGYWVKHTEATRDVATYSAGVRDRLAAAGWTVHDYRVAEPEALIDGGNEYDATFWATRPGLVLSFSDHYWTGRPSYDSTGAAAFDLWRQPTPWMRVVTGLGALAGALLFLLAMRAIHRRATPRSRPALGTAAVVAVIFLLPSTLGAGEEGPMESPWWGGFYYLGLGPAVISASIAGGILLYALTKITAVRRHPRLVAAAALVAVAAALLPWTVRQFDRAVVAAPCSPAGVPAEPAGAKDSTHVQIFVSNTSTPQERALIDAAIFRSRAGSLGELIWRPDSAEFRATYCDGGEVAAAAVPSLPYFFDVDLSNAATFPALTEEVNGLPGVVAVQRARER